MLQVYFLLEARKRLLQMAGRHIGVRAHNAQKELDVDFRTIICAPGTG
tara:strand:+ start:9343 stop:9486 length:144 start_codon:yes stop_codon:yes gene_type:complete